MSPYVTPQTLAADFDGDGTVGFPDFLLFAAQYGTFGLPNKYKKARQSVVFDGLFIEYTSTDQVHFG